MTHITLVKSSNWCNILPILHRLNHLTSVIYGPTNTEAATNAQERRLWFVLHLFYCLVYASCCFFLLPSLRFLPSLSFETFPLPHPHSNAKFLHSYKTATSLHIIKKTSLSHPHLMSYLQYQVCVS